jgi:hypothetical protein
MEAAGYSETFVTIYETTLCHVTEDILSSLQRKCYEVLEFHLKSHDLFFYLVLSLYFYFIRFYTKTFKIIIRVCTFS